MKEKFLEMMHEAGYSSVNKFAKACGMETCNVLTNLNGKNKPGIDRMFRYADTLSVPVLSVIYLFYADEVRENNTAVSVRYGEDYNS